MAVRTHARRHTIKVGTDKYLVGKKATRSVAKTAKTATAGATKSVTTTKSSGGAIVRSTARSLTGTKGFRIGKYAKANATVNADGSTTYATKNGGTKTVAMSVTGTPKKKRARGSGSSGSGSGSGSGGTSGSGSGYGGS